MAYESIKDKLSSLSIYNIVPGGLVEAEIRAYAAGLQGLYDAVDNAVRECFITTAENEGLTNLELMSRIYIGGDEIEDRRKKLLTRLSVKPVDIGEDGLKKAVASLGLDCNITENNPNSWLFIDILTDVAESKRDFIKAEVKKFAPPHLVIFVTFNGE